MKNTNAFLILGLILSMNMFMPTSATDYIVGGSLLGWTVSLVDYVLWSAENVVRVGDNLIFKYAADLHNLVEVSFSDYQSCTVGTPLSPVYNTGYTVIPVPAPGLRYFISSVGLDCVLGMKLAVDVKVAV